MEDQKKKVDRSVLDGFSPVSSTRIDWKSRKRSSSASGRNKVRDDDAAYNETTPNEHETTTKPPDGPTEPPPELSERRKALFEPLEPMTNLNGQLRLSAEALLPPPDFDAASYPRGWLIGKKRKLVNIDVVESMRRIAVQEMNRKDREIGELNDILDEDSKVLELVQKQLLEERGKTAHLERENAMLREQVKMLMGLLEEDEQAMDDEDEHPRGDGSNKP